MVRILTETITIPKDLLKDLRAGLTKVEGVLAMLEEIADREGQRRVRRAKAEYRKWDYIIIGKGEDLLRH